jgi:hypothetical protein
MIRSRAWGGALALALLVPAAAAAQAPRNPFADLFGRAPQRTGREFTSVQFRTTTGVQVGQTLEADFEQSDVVPDGVAGSTDANLVAQYMRDRVQAIGNGRYSYQEFRQTPAFGTPAFDAGGRVNLKATTRLSFQADGQFVRAPFFQALWLAPEAFGPSAAPSNVPAILLLQNDSIQAGAGFTGQFTKRSSLSATAFTRETRFELSPDNNFTSRGARAQWKRQLGRSFGLHAGYGREEMRQRSTDRDERFVNELVDVGVDFSKSLSMGRRTMFGFATETALISENGGPRQFRLNGTVMFERRFLRTWITQLSARRATEFMPGFRGPVFTERGHAELAGYFAKRLLFNLGGEGGQGHVGIGDARQFISYTGNATVTFGMTRHIGLFTQYAYYHYQMPPDPFALVTVPRLSRQAVAFGVKTWVSLIDKEKVPRDPR